MNTMLKGHQATLCEVEVVVWVIKVKDEGGNVTWWHRTARGEVLCVRYVRLQRLWEPSVFFLLCCLLLCTEDLILTSLPQNHLYTLGKIKVQSHVST